jgi:hypothetical protein
MDCRQGFAKYGMEFSGLTSSVEHIVKHLADDHHHKYQDSATLLSIDRRACLTD